jgi:hypothetical protein
LRGFLFLIEGGNLKQKLMSIFHTAALQRNPQAKLAEVNNAYVIECG